MAPDRLANICKNNNPYSRRAKGKPKERWKNNINIIKGRQTGAILVRRRKCLCSK